MTGPAAAVLTVLGILLTAAVITAVFNVKIVSESEAYVLERLGAFRKVWLTGIHIKFPVIERIRVGVTLMEQVADFPPWPAITKDNVIIKVDTVVFFQISDPMSYAYGVQRPLKAIENLTATILRSIIGEMSLDDTLSSRDTINRKMRKALDEATDSWGIKVNRVELSEIVTPPGVQEAMEKEMRAERDKRETLLQAEAEAEAIRLVQKARAEAIQMINQAAPGDEYLRLQAMDMFTKVADGKATKIVIPSDMQGIAGLAGLAQGMGDMMNPGE